MFRCLGWICREEGNHGAMLAQASIEGWFPKDKWGELNRVYAGLGQIFRDKLTGHNFLEHAFEKSEDPNCPFSYSEYVMLEKIALEYSVPPLSK